MAASPPHPSWLESISFANDGGLLIVLPRERFAAWRGSTRPFRDASASSDDDYERACAAKHPGELIAVGNGRGLVIGAQDHACPVRWVSLAGAPSPFLVGWRFAEEGARKELYELLGGDVSWTRLRHSQRIEGGELVLFHAASPGDELREGKNASGHAVIGDAIPAPLPPGEYAVELAVLESDRYGCVAGRWVAVSAGHEEPGRRNRPRVR